ncbi:unnamed protein product [Acanthoscelides obtectus]|uniref:Calponin-homology (CH) domain-containing protein n=2 Tax=Acanthoscelides obtectus TaxID=200917 RepID=A0A9P0PH11_ACAOB|nr:unnamed protein product [Acanthoscelides obtectus]CAK1666429.1 Cytospin-B [Acanthoscelides obtectus]
MKSIKAIFRRGQNVRLDGQNLDNLSRTSSVTNLEEQQLQQQQTQQQLQQQQLHYHPKGTKPRKTLSKERIDKTNEPTRRNEKKNSARNNNKIESGESPYLSIDSLQEEEFIQLRKQLQDMAQEKTNLALQLGEQKGQLNILQKEIQKLKSFQEESNVQLEHLTAENTLLRNRLRDVAHSPLSDTEKQQLLDSHRHHSSAPASIATNLLEDDTGVDATPCTTPDWDKYSSGNVSEVSVACLQDKIHQMQETHYSTNEELQATLQELTDLQRQLIELQQENERLNDEKTLMFDSLCRQTERLNDSRSEVESLKQLIYQEKGETDQYGSIAEREQKLVDLLKAAQEERENLMVKLEQMTSELQETKAALLDKDNVIQQMNERIKTLEYTLDARYAEHKQLDQELMQARDQCNGKQIEINRLNDLLDNAKTKVQNQCQLEDKRQLSAVLSETQRNLNETERKSLNLERELEDLKRLRAEENEEWEKFQSDLLTSVRVANDFKTEAQQELQRMIMENKTYRERERQLRAEIEKLKVESVPLRPTSFPSEDVTLRRKNNIVLSRQNSRQSVKSLIESIESQAKPVTKTGLGTVVSRSSSNSSLNSLTSDVRSPSGMLVLPTPTESPLKSPPDWNDVNTIGQTKSLKEQQTNKLNRDWSSVDKHEVKIKTDDNYREALLQKGMDFSRRNSYSDLSERKDPLNGLVKNGGSKRNALLKWCQSKTVGYRNIDITNFSSSWNDGLALCALMHTYLPEKIPYDSLTPQEKRKNFSLAFSAAESVGIPTTLNINDMVQQERPDWQQVMGYVTAIYKHFET